MPVTEKPSRYVSSGREFATKVEAERHDSLLVAREKLEDAQRNFQRLLAENAKTADGYAFEFGVFRDYQHVVCPHLSRPCLRKVSFLCWNWTVREQRDRPEVVEIADEDGEKRTWYVPIRSLYYDPDKATAALRAAQVQWLEEQQEAIDPAPSRPGPAATTGEVGR